MTEAAVSRLVPCIQVRYTSGEPIRRVL